MKVNRVSLTLALALGAIMGFLSLGKVAATVIYIDVYLHPGATSVMNCGWHAPVFPLFTLARRWTGKMAVGLPSIGGIMPFAVTCRTARSALAQL